jgi:hypothetical protein
MDRRMAMLDRYNVLAMQAALQNRLITPEALKSRIREGISQAEVVYSAE